MTDYDLLELLAAQAPAPVPSFADQVLTRARRARLRRRALSWGAGFAAVTLFMVAVVMLRPDGYGRGGPTPPTPPVAASESSAPHSAEAGAYASAIVALAEAVREEGPRARYLYIVDHTCTNIIRATPGGDTSCHPQPLPPSLRDQLAVALAWYAPAQFVASPVAVREPGSLTIINGGMVVTLGPIELSYNQALVPLTVARNGLQGAAVTYELRRSDASWVVVGTVGPRAVS